MIYRVTVKTTGSLRPGDHDTSWDSEVTYCGSDLEEARIEYLKSSPKDYFHGYGNSCRRTEMKQFESEPDDIDDETAEDVE